MTDAKPLSTSTDRPVSRRRLLAIAAAVPAAIALPGRIGASAPQAPPPASPVGATSALTAPAYWFC
jgi:hypothetical protein